MEDNKKGIQQITLAEIVNESINFNRGKKTQEEMAKLGEKMTIRSYLPILEKYRYLCLLIFKLNSSKEHHELNIVNMEKDLFFDVLLGAYGFIDVSDMNLRDHMTMDILYPIFAPYILQYCKDDYNIFVRMLQETISLYHIQELVDVMQSIDYKKIEESTQENKKLFEDLEKNKEVIKQLKEMGYAFNPDTRKIVKIGEKLAQQSVIENIKEQQKDVVKDIQENDLEKEEKIKEDL